MEKQIRKKALVLLVDDDESLLELIKMALKQNQYEVATATNGQEAIAKIKESEPALVILDVMMPIMDGFEACRVIKSNRNFGNIPVLMLSAKSHKSDLEQGKLSGADRYITKPFDFNEFLNIVGTYLQKA
jgi:DNA-binding response OmpR family regulator